MANNQQLELRWIGKDDPLVVEPRILIENPKLSFKQSTISLFNDEGLYDNVLIHGDNLLALKSIDSEFHGQIKCIYIDPPYNTGSAFENYDDNVEHSIWLNLMRGRLQLLKGLLRDDGSIFIQISDDEEAYLKVLCDEVFGRNNYVNTIAVNMKNIAGASGGGEDKRLKKNVEFILIYARQYDKMSHFKNVYSYTEIYEMVKQCRDNGVSWKYTTALIDPGKKEYVGSTVDGEGDDISIFKRTDYSIKSIGEIMKSEHLSEKEAYKKYAYCIFQTAMPQSSIRPRVMTKVNEIGIESEVYSIEYTPKTGKNKGKLYEQFYKGKNFRLFAWLKDVTETINGELFKKTLQGTYWDFTAGTKNLTKEGNVEFPNGKKPEALVSRILDMATDEGDLVLDSFLGSGTTSAVAHKMKRRWIGIEMGEQVYTHCKPRIDSIIKGEDKNGITESVKWTSGGGYKFYELAPTLVKEDILGQPIINKEYNAELLASAVALHEGFKYSPDQSVFWKQSKSTENAYLFVTTAHVDLTLLKTIERSMSDVDYLLIACKSFDINCKDFSRRIKIKKIPQMLLGKCEFNKDNYNLNIVNPPVYEEDDEDE